MQQKRRDEEGNRAGQSAATPPGFAQQINICGLWTFCTQLLKTNQKNVFICVHDDISNYSKGESWVGRSSGVSQKILIHSELSEGSELHLCTDAVTQQEASENMPKTSHHILF